MTRRLIGNIAAPLDAVKLADFTDGSIPLAQLTYNAGSPNASGRNYTYDSNGIMIEISGGTTGQYASVRWEPGTIMDLSAYEYIAWELDVPEDGGGGYQNGINVYVGSDAGTTFTNYRNRSSRSGAVLTPPRSLLLNRIRGETWTSAGSPNWASVRKFDFRMVIHADAQNIPAKFYIRGIWVGGRARTKIILSFDDLADGQVNHALPELSAVGMKAALAIAPIHAGGAGKLTEANLQTLYDAGWDFGCQQYNDTADAPVNQSSSLTSDGLGTATWQNLGTAIDHGYTVGQRVLISGAMSPAYNGTVTVLSTPTTTSFTYAISGTPTTPDKGWATCPRLSLTAAKAAWQNTLDWLAARGWTRGNQFAAYSSGITNDWVESWMPDLGFRMARSTRLNASPFRGFDPRITANRAMMRLPGQTMDQQTATTILGYVDDCIKYGASLIFYAHDIDATPAALTVTLTEWQAIVAGLAARRNQGLIDVITPTEYLAQVVNGRAGV